MFNALLKSAKVSAKVAGVLSAGSIVKPTLRGDGGGGFVLVLGRMGIQNGMVVRYGSKKAPLSVTTEITTLDGKTETEIFQVTDADGVHLGKVNAEDVQALVKNIKSIKVVEIKG